MGLLAGVLVWPAGRPLAALAALSIAYAHLMFGPQAAGQRDTCSLCSHSPRRCSQPGGWKSLSMVQVYTKGADQERLARELIGFTTKKRTGSG